MALALALAGLAVVAAGGVGTLEVRFALVVAATVAVPLGVRRHRPTHPRPWWLLTTGLATSAVGDASVLVARSRGTLPGTLPVDAWLTAASGVLLLAAVLSVVRAVGGSTRLGALDAVIAATAAATLLWQLLVVPAAVPGWSGGGTELAGAIQVAALLAVLALLTQIGGLVPRRCRTALGWLVAGLVLALTAFLVGAVRDATGADAYGGVRAVAGAGANLAAAAAALHPSMRWLTVRAEVPREGTGPGRTVLLAAALAAPPLVLAVAAWTDRPLSLPSLAFTWTALSVALLARGVLAERGREAARVQLARSERRTISLVANTGDAVLLVTLPDRGDPLVRFASPSARRLLGQPPELLRRRSVLELVDAVDRDRVEVLLRGPGALPRSADLRLPGAAGGPRWVEAVVSAAPQEEVASVVLTLRDVDERKRTELALVEAAARDPLTGLLNRRAFEALVADALGPSRGDEPAPARRRATDVVLLAVDLDRFKVVNDRAGHATGDAVLVEVAMALGAAVRETDVLARIGGDEFAVLCRSATDVATVRPVADRIAGLAVEPATVPGVSVGACVGIAAAVDGDTVASLLARADGALYEAKALGPGSVAESR